MIRQYKNESVMIFGCEKTGTICPTDDESNLDIRHNGKEVSTINFTSWCETVHSVGFIDIDTNELSVYTKLKSYLQEALSNGGLPIELIDTYSADELIEHASGLETFFMVENYSGNGEIQASWEDNNGKSRDVTKYLDETELLWHQEINWGEQGGETFAWFNFMDDFDAETLTYKSGDIAELYIYLRDKLKQQNII